jgi:hypothetical protein
VVFISGIRYLLEYYRLVVEPIPSQRLQFVVLIWNKSRAFPERGVSSAAGRSCPLPVYGGSAECALSSPGASGSIRLTG